MSARYISTTLATEWEQESDGVTTILDTIFRFLPRANPGYDSKLKFVRRWLIEFPDGDMPDREIGLDGSGRPVLSGPGDKDYGFWLDTGMNYKDFEGDSITPQEFEECWKRAIELQHRLALE